MSNSNFELLLNKYNQLPDDSRNLIQLCAVHSESVSFERLFKLSTTAFGGKLNSKAIKSSLNQMVKSELLESPRPHQFSVNKEILDYGVQDSIRSGEFEKLAKVAQSLFKRDGYYFSYNQRTDPLLIRDMRIAYYQNDVLKFNSLRARLPKSITASPNLIRVLEPFDADIFARLNVSLQERYFVDAITRAVTSGEASPEVIKLAGEFFESRVEEDLEINKQLFECILDMNALMGDLAGLSALDKLTSGQYPEILGCEAFLRGDWQKAEECFVDAIAKIRKSTRIRNAVMRHVSTIFYALLLLRKDSLPARNQLTIVLKQMMLWPMEYRSIVVHLEDAMNFQASTKAGSRLSTISNDTFVSKPLLSQVVAASLLIWFQPKRKLTTKVLRLLQEEAVKYEQNAFKWIAAEALSRIASFEKTNRKKLESKSQQIHSELNTVTLCEFIKPVEPWHRSLNALEKFGDNSLFEEGSEKNYGVERLVWDISYDVRSSSFELSPAVQKITKKGEWSKGRTVKVSSLLDSDYADYQFLTSQDRAICESLRYECSYHYRYDFDNDIDYSKVATALAGHPLVFCDKRRSSTVEIHTQEPKLIIGESGKSSIRISLEPTIGDSDVQIIEDGPRRLIFVLYSDAHRCLLDIVGRKGINVPASHQARVLSIVNSIASQITVHSHVGTDAGEVVDADPRPHIHLLPFKGGVQVEFFVQPLGSKGPFYRPKIGGQSVILELDEKRVSARRDFEKEQQLATDIIKTCPVFGEHVEAPLASEFLFPTSEEALELMLQLQRLVDEEKIELHWPRGEKFRVLKEVGCSQFHLNIGRENDWFSASGELKVDETLSLDLLKMLQLFELSPSRFIKMDDGQFLALTNELRSRVEELAAYSEQRKGDLRFPAIRAAAMGDLEDVFQVTADDEWKKCIERINDSMSYVPSVPSTFKGELRDYQIEGFQWLCRLARWGVGACLADDMGLGKTIQALALILERANEGCTLIIAPTSVGFNWINEITRFAPSLNARLFGTGDRQAFFENLGPRDVVVCSWGLLHREAERFQAQTWHTVVLDEAQAIKNMGTQRSKTAMGLQADFRLIMTGTPIENHLGELWNLFNFINSGLLGSAKSFRDEFTVPIEKYRCKETQSRLRKLIHPFILRRTKTEVLDELPARTEITIEVELSSEEAALYDAMRKQAVLRLSDENDEDKTPKYLKIFAELMRLRRFCCHPKLVMPEASFCGSKLALFLETIAELLDNGHKVLVFSQFVDHLRILQEALIEKGIEYKYLDGSTTVSQRKSRVEAFQAGDGNVFLISLKAGGLGLNLTEADYVLHMDPWWNPAVEDQASDRAHRLGQKRPVTIYRFITKGTIEERIVKLHGTKRDLADTLLQGTDMSGKLSAKELLKLMRE